MAGAAIGALALLWVTTLSTQIIAVGRSTPSHAADVAIVLGAAAYGAQPSPVFEERIRHGIRLYRSGQVRKLLFNGGYGPGARHAEATVGRLYAAEQGVPAADIAAETSSRTTYQNLVQAHRLMRDRNLHTALIVSDPLHLKRALHMADDLGIRASAAPTSTSRFRTWRSKSGFLLRELYFYHHYLIAGE